MMGRNQRGRFDSHLNSASNKQVKFWVGVVLFYVLTSSAGAWAGGAKSSSGKLIVLADDVTIYSGPSFRFRPLRSVDKGAELAVSSSQQEGPDGLFYQVYYQYKKSGRKVVGYISVGAPVDVSKSAIKEDVSAYDRVELADSGVWVSFNALGKDNYLWGLSYVKYLNPGVYYKILAGQLVNLSGSNTLLGGEVGLDQLLWGKLSVYSGFSWSLLFSAKEDSVFTASQGVTPIVIGAFGVRYNVDRFAAISGGLLFSSVFNQNNAQLFSGVGLGLEVGL